MASSELIFVRIRYSPRYSHPKLSSNASAWTEKFAPASVHTATGRPAGAARQRAEGFERVLVAVLGVDRLAGAEFDRAAGHPHLLALLAGEMHLDAMALGIVEGVVAEAVEVEIAAELAVDARQQVEVERRR